MASQDFLSLKNIVAKEMDSIARSITNIKLAMLEYENRFPAKKQKKEETQKLKPTYSSVASSLFDEDERHFKSLGKIPGCPEQQKLTLSKLTILTESDKFTEQVFKSRIQFLGQKTTREHLCGHIFPVRTYANQEITKAMILPDADPVIAYELFCLGLINSIFITEDFNNIKFFPKNLKGTVAHFYKNVMQNRSQMIELRFTSTLPCWIQTKMICPIHVIFMKGADELPIFTDEPPVEEPDKFIDSFRIDQILFVSRQLKKLKKMKIKVNYSTSQIFLYSGVKKTSEKDDKILHKFLVNFNENFINNLPEADFKEYSKMLIEEETKIDKPSGSKVSEADDARSDVKGVEDKKDDGCNDVIMTDKSGPKTQL